MLGRLGYGLAGVLLFAANLLASDPIKVGVRDVHDVENGTVTTVGASFQGEKVIFVVPGGWRAQKNSDSSVVTLAAPGGVAAINVLFSTERSTTVRSEAARMQELSAVTGFATHEEFEVHTGRGSGRALDISCHISGAHMKGRIAVIPGREGAICFALTASAESWPEAQQSLGRVLTSFRTAPDDFEIRDGGQFPALAQPNAHTLSVPEAGAEQLPPAPLEPPPALPEAAPVRMHVPGIRPDCAAILIASLLVVVLTARVILRHRREAEIRALSGVYLSDGTEISRYVMPEWFAAAAEPGPAKSSEAEEKLPLIPAAPPAVLEFFDKAPERIVAVRQKLHEVCAATEPEDRQSKLKELHALVAELHEKAGAWELRPAWQMSSALALLVERVAAKTKDATPSALQTIAGCVDMLQEICVPGIRPNLLIDPPVKTMVVDDDPLCRRALQFALEKAGIEPDAASSGEQAVELAKAQAYDVVFMDIQMPGLDGLTACSFIRETEKNRDVPVIFVTVQSDFNTRAQSRLRGAADLMAKPFFVFEVTAKALMYAMRRRLRAAAAVSNRREVALVPEVAPSTAPAEAVAA